MIILILVSCQNRGELDIIKSYIEAHNNHDIDRVLSHFQPSIEFELSGTWTKKGLGDMRSLEEWDTELNSHLCARAER